MKGLIRKSRAYSKTGSIHALFVDHIYILENITEETFTIQIPSQKKFFTEERRTSFVDPSGIVVLKVWADFATVVNFAVL